MDITEIIYDYKLSQKLYLYNQKEITIEVDDEEDFWSIYDIFHGFHMTPRHKIGKSSSKADSFYDSFRQGLKEHDIVITVNELKEICKSFALDPPTWFAEGINNNLESSTDSCVKSWQEYLKDVYTNNRWNDPDVKAWIICTKFENLTVYFIKNEIIKGNENFTTKIIKKKEIATIKSALFFSEQTEITIVDFGGENFEPVVHVLKETLRCKSDNENEKAKKTKVKAGTIPKNLNHDIKTDVLDKVNSLENTIKQGDINTLKNTLHHLFTVDKNLLDDVFKDPNNNLKSTNLVVLACKHNQLNILQYLIHDCNFLHHLPSCGTETYQYKDDAINNATLTMNINLLETLYDHFADELHWSCHRHNKDITQTLKELNGILIKTWMNCLKNINKDLQMVVDLHCLIEVSQFQIDLYTELGKISYDISSSDDIRKAETEMVVQVLLTVLRTHQEYNSKDIRLPSGISSIEMRIKKLFTDETSIYMKHNHEFMYDVYYRKLDSVAALLILDNLHYLQQRLELPSKEYKKIESAIYYFIYRVYEDWRLFLPKNRIKTKAEYIVDGSYKSKFKVAAIYDETKLLLGPALYLSRRNFCDALSKFQEVLQSIDIGMNIRVKGKKLPVEEINKLTLLPLMRDHFSLQKILVYLDSLSKVDLDVDKDFGILMIESTIQVVGELLKISNESVHISSMTETLLQFMIPIEIIKVLRQLRDFLSRAEKTQPLRRIYVMSKEANIYNDVLKDLNEFKKRIYEVIHLYSPVLDEWIIKKGLNIIDHRKSEIPLENMHILKVQLLTLPPLFLPEAFIEGENKLMEKYNISRQLLREINSLNKNYDELSSIYDYIKDYLIRQVKENLGNFSKVIGNRLRFIEQNFTSNPEECIEKWEFVVNIFEFIVIVVRFLDSHPMEITHSLITNMIKDLKNGSSNDRGIALARRLLKEINAYSTVYKFPRDSSSKAVANINFDYEFKGIKSLKSTLDQHFRFIIPDELRHLFDDIETSYGNEADNVFMEHKELFNNIKNNEPINTKDCRTLCSLKVNNESKRIICCLDKGSNRDLRLSYCLKNRIELLTRLLEGQNDIINLTLRYKHDEKFQICLEMLLIDIMNILMRIKETHALTKQDKLYTDANIRNILEHSEPLLEDIGKALDPKDFATELVIKAMEFIQKADDWIVRIRIFEDKMAQLRKKKK